MSKRADGRPERTRAVSFTRDAADRIAKAVRGYEAGDRSGLPVRSYPRLSSDSRPALKMGKFNGSWPKGTTKSVSLYGANSEVVTVMNFIADLTNGCGWRRCIIAKMEIPVVSSGVESDETEKTWTLVSAEVA